MKKGSVLLLVLMLLTVAGSVFLPSAVSSRMTEGMLDQVQTVEDAGEFGRIGQTPLTLAEKLAFISREDVLRTQTDRDEEAVRMLEILGTQLNMTNYEYGLTDFPSAKELHEQCVRYNVKRNCYIDPETFQCVFTLVAVFAFDADPYMLSLELEIEPDSEKLIGMNILSSYVTEDIMDSFYGYFPSDLPMLLQRYLFGYDREGEVEMSISETEQWKNMSRDNVIEFELGAEGNIRYTVYYYVYDYRNGQFKLGWEPSNN